MYFSNLLNERGVGEFKRNSRVGVIPFVGSVESGSVEGHVCIKDGKIVVDEAGDGDLFMKGMEGDKNSPYLEVYKSGLTFGDVADTEENPLIVVLAKSIKFYVGVKTFIKFLNISNDAVMVCLVYGACEFTFDDGTSVALQRCNLADLENKKVKEFSAKDLREHCAVMAGEGKDYNIEWDCVNALLVNLTSEYSGSFRAVREECNIFSTAGIEKANERYQEKLKQKAEEQRIREERKKQFKLEQEAKEKAARLKEEEELKEKKAKRAASAKKKIEESQTVSGGQDASNTKGRAFLDIVASL